MSSRVEEQRIDVGEILVIVASTYDGQAAIGDYTIDVSTQNISLEICGDGADNDQNGQTDCADPSCVDDPGC